MDLIPMFILIYLAVGALYFMCQFEYIYTMYDLWGCKGVPEFLVIIFIIVLWLPIVIIESVTYWTVDATYNMVKWFVLKGQIDKDGFEKEDFWWNI